MLSRAIVRSGAGAVLLALGCSAVDSRAGGADVGQRSPSASEASAPRDVAAEDALPAPRPRGPGFRRGVSLGLFVSTQDERWRQRLYRTFLDEIAAVGATDLQLVVQWSQRDVFATEIAPLAGVSVDDELLSWVMDEAGKRGLRVFLLPTLHLEQRGRGHWRGKLVPADWDAWWDSYRGFILHYAELGQAHGVDLLAVGSELISTEAQQDRWRALIADVRERFRGELTYSANWDHFEPVGFWDALDVAGITGYQELSAAPSPDEESLVRGFDGLRQRVRSWSAQSGRRFVFTEVGYASQPGAARHPWDYRPRQESDLALQLRCYRALFRAWHDDPALAGIYFWNWFGEGGPGDTGYTPRGKPAAEVVRHWYARR